MPFIRRLGLRGLLSFPPDMEPFELQSLNVLIGPNGSGKTNLIEALELLRATPTDFAAAIRDGGGAEEWLWKGENPTRRAAMDIEIGGKAQSTGRTLRYRLEFASSNNRVEVLDEAIEEASSASPDHEDVHFHYRFQQGNPVINVKDKATEDSGSKRRLKMDGLLTDQSVLAQCKEPDLSPEVAWVGRMFGRIHVFREWTFGRHAPLRQPQPADLPTDRLLPDNRNLALLLNEIEHRDPRRLNQLIEQFLPGFERLSTKVAGGTVQFHLHESGFESPIPPARLSDGTVRFIAILATLLAPSPPPLVCIENPELGLHPDALTLIADLMFEAAERMQLVVTTHSDALVSELSQRPEAVVTCERLGTATTLERVDPERLAHWLKDYTLGDVWRMGALGANP